MYHVSTGCYRNDAVWRTYWVGHSTGGDLLRLEENRNDDDDDNNYRCNRRNEAPHVPIIRGSFKSNRSVRFQIDYYRRNFLDDAFFLKKSVFTFFFFFYNAPLPFAITFVTINMNKNIANNKCLQILSLLLLCRID